MRTRGVYCLSSLATKKNPGGIAMNEHLVTDQHDSVELSVEIVAAYVSHNALSPTDLPKLIADVHAALQGTSVVAAPAEIVDDKKPAVSIRKSITPDYLVCLEDGKKFKSVKRHLRLAHNFSPEEYRTKWNLAADYPMVAATYSASRSALAKTIGLGRKPGAKVKKTRRIAAKV
jgi:predicted transcriptional regulator